MITHYHKAIPFPNHTNYSREDLRPLVTKSSAIMIVVHSAVVSTLYLWVVISSLHRWLENPPFCHCLYFLWCMVQRSLHAITKDYYKSMSCFTTDSLAKGPACNAKDSTAKGPSCTMWFRQITKYDTENDANLHSSEQNAIPIAFLISKQVVLYRTHRSTCCPGCLHLRFSP
jgi:hypothetical protein